MKAPSAGFAQDGLARLFGVNLKPSKASSSNRKTAEIAGPICGVVGFVCLAAGFAWIVRKHCWGTGTSRDQEIHEKGASDIPNKDVAHTREDVTKE